MPLAELYTHVIYSQPDYPIREEMKMIRILLFAKQRIDVWVVHEFVPLSAFNPHVGFSKQTKSILSMPLCVGRAQYNNRRSPDGVPLFAMCLCRQITDAYVPETIKTSEHRNPPANILSRIDAPYICRYAIKRVYNSMPMRGAGLDYNQNENAIKMSI